MKSLLSCYRWISGRIIQTFKRVTWVIALWRQLTKKATIFLVVYINMLHKTINQMSAVHSWDGIWGLLQPHQSHLHWGDLHLTVRLQCEQVQQRQRRENLWSVAMNEMAYLINYCPFTIIAEPTSQGHSKHHILPIYRKSEGRGLFVRVSHFHSWDKSVTPLPSPGFPVVGVQVYFIWRLVVLY